MGKSCKVVVCGQSVVGKTAVLEQLLYANHVAGTFFLTWITYVPNNTTDLSLMQGACSSWLSAVCYKLVILCVLTHLLCSMSI